MEISARKGDHVRIALDQGSSTADRAFAPDVRFTHNALPELAFEELDPSVELLGRRLSLPLVIASMTGGYSEGGVLNGRLAEAAERHGVAMGIGSQRAALRAPESAMTYRIARERAPTAMLMANVGAAQLVPQGASPPLTLDEVTRLIDMIRADVLVVHLNALQELIQPEGDRNTKGWTEAIAKLAGSLPLPVVAKETGGGISSDVARRLLDSGVAAIDVGGLGGTSFAAIEGRRAAEQGDERGVALAAALADWGIGTAASIRHAADTGLPVIATGGIRTGLDAAKAIALGARAVGVGRPLLQAAMDGPDALDAWFERFRESLLGVQFLTGSRTAGDLSRALATS